MNTEDIQKLALLARIAMDDEEAKNLNLNSVLEYIKAIESAPTTLSEESNTKKNVADVYNVVREDVVIETPQDTKDLIKKNFPLQKNNYLEVNKILHND